MGVFDFLKKKEEVTKPTKPLKTPFKTPSGETIVEEVGSEDIQPTKPAPAPPPPKPLPKDPFDLVDEPPPFKLKQDFSKDLDEIRGSLMGIAAQLKAVSDKLKSVSDRLRR
jgi:hypothetical protein